MNGKDAEPIAPLFPGETSVSKALQQALSRPSRAVVEIADGGFRLHAITALAALEREGQGQLKLRELDAIKFGLPEDRLQTRGSDLFGGELGEAHSEVALRVSIVPVPPGRNIIAPASFAAHLRSDSILGVVSYSYKCPKDGERFSGSGICDLHNVDLVPANDP